MRSPTRPRRLRSAPILPLARRLPPTPAPALDGDARYVTPFRAPQDAPPLYDFMAAAQQGAQSSKPLINDLMFSGHTSSTLVAAMAMRRPRWQPFAYAGVCVVVALILMQKAHYTIDVVVAPFVVYSCRRFVETQFHGGDCTARRPPPATRRPAKRRQSPRRRAKNP